jgi:hypothetical protein
MSHVSYLSPKSAGGDSDDGQTRFDVLSDNDPSPQPAAASESAGAGAAVVSPEQVHVQIPATAAPPAKKPAPVAEPAKKASPAPMAAPAAVKIAAPVAAAASSSTASRKSAAPLSSPIAANGVTAGQMAHVKSQVTAACHITPATGDGSEGNVFVHVIDGQGVFGCTPADLTYLVLHASTRPSDYSVVGIMGCQSTGQYDRAVCASFAVRTGG